MKFFTMEHVLTFILLIFTVTEIVFCQNVQQQFNPAEFIDKLLENYVKSDPPTSNGPTEVLLGMNFESIHDVDHGESMQMTSNFYFRQTWTDPRLTFNSSDAGGRNRIELPDGARDRIWLPDTYFRNQIDLYVHGVANLNVFLTVATTGKVLSVTHYHLVTSCPMELDRYPFDEQSCPITMESWRYPTTSLQYNWLDDNPVVYNYTRPIEHSKAVRLPGYSVTDTLLKNCTQIYTEGASISCLEVQFVLHRSVGFYFLQYFLPTILYVIISWFSFWIDAGKYPERIFFLMFMMLLLTIQYTIVDGKVLQVSNVKATDVWMLICMIFIFLALMEAVVLKVLGTNLVVKPKEEGTDDVAEENTKVGDYAVLMGKVYTPSEVMKIVDQICRIAFPAVFLLVVILFFSAYSR